MFKTAIGLNEIVIYTIMHSLFLVNASVSAAVTCLFFVILKHVSDQGPDRRYDFLIRSQHYL